jgi:peptidoglycan/LPS O-acetylase OafA/YrhL
LIVSRGWHCLVLYISDPCGRECCGPCSDLLPPRASTVVSALVTLLASLVTFGIAQMSWRFIEVPMQRRGHAFKY